MAVLKRFKEEEIRKQFTHYGLFWGVVPVYVNMRNSEAPDVAVRNWLPEWLLNAVDSLSAIPIWIKTLVDDSYVPMFSIKLTGVIGDGE